MHATRNVLILPSLFKNQNVKVRNPIDKQDLSYQLQGSPPGQTSSNTNFVQILSWPDAIKLN